MSACSSADGSSVRFRKHSSVRKRPTPSTGSEAAEDADPPSATLASSLTGVPSAVAPGPDHAASAARASWPAAPGASRIGGVGVELDGAGGAVDEHRRRRRELEGAGGADDAGDAQLAGDDRGVAGGSAPLGDQRHHHARVEAGGVGGSEVLGDQHRGLRGRGHARLGLAHQAGDEPPLDVAQVGDALGHQPAHAGEHADELLDGGGDRGRAGRRSPRSPLRTAPRSPLSRASPALAVSTSAAAPEAARPWRRTRRRRLDGVVVRRERSVGIGEPAVTESCDGVGRRSRRGRRGRAVGDAGDDRGAA